MSGDAGQEPLETAQRLHAQALDALEHYQPDSAGALLDSAADILDTQPLPLGDPRVQEVRVRVILAQAWVAFERNGIDAAQPSLNEAFTLSRALDRRDLQSRCYLQSATMQARSGDLRTAHSLMREAAIGLADLPPTDQARVYANRGVLASQLMVLDEASGDLAIAAELAERAGAHAVAFMARHNAGYVDFLRGDLPAALASMRAADAMAVEVNRSVSHLDRARVLLEAGLLDDAAEALRTAHDLASADGIGQDLAEIELDQARTALLLGDPLAAATHASAARLRFRARNAAPWSRRAELVALEASTYAVQPPPQTVPRALRLAELAASHGEAHIAQRANLVAADALAHLARPTRRERELAHTAYLQARPLARSPSLATRLHVRYVGALLARSDQPERTRRHLAAAASDLAGVAQRTSSLDLRTALAVHSVRLSTLDVAIGMGTSRASAAFTRTERWRGVSERVPVVRPPHNRDAADLLTQLRRVHEDLRGAVGTTHGSLTLRAADLERQVRALDWGVVSPGRDSPARATPLLPVAYSEALRVCRDTDTTLVSYFVHDDRLHAVVLRPEGRPQGMVVALAPRDQVRDALQRARADVDAAALPTLGPIRNVIEGSLRDSLIRLDALVGGPAIAAAEREAGRMAGRGATHLMRERVVFVPNRLLSGLPWGMLPSRRGLPTTVARSATAWVAAQRYAAPVPSPVVRALAGPDLAHADAEAHKVGELWGGDATGALESNRAALAAALTEADIVHVAAHGSHHHQSPLFSTLQLGDGAVFAHELPTQDLRTSHVVLSACDVGRATIRPGDESLGLAAVLLSLGVRCVVASANRIPDEVAMVGMTAYHSLLSQGLDSATALAMATADLPLSARALTCFGAPWSAEALAPRE